MNALRIAALALAFTALPAATDARAEVVPCDTDADCSDDTYCAWNECLPGFLFCLTDNDCADSESCEKECVQYDFEAGQCVSTRGTCQYNPKHLEIPELCTDFCTRLAPCYDAPTSRKVRYCSMEDEGDCTVEELERLYFDEVLECKLACMEVVGAGGSAGQAMEALAACCTQSHLQTCAEVAINCEEEAVVALGPAAGTGSGFLNTKAAGNVTLGSSTGGSSGCGVAPSPAPAAGPALLLVLVLVVLRPGRRSRSDRNVGTAQ